jgi:hypothetical protein
MNAPDNAGRMNGPVNTGRMNGPVNTGRMNGPVNLGRMSAPVDPYRCGPIEGDGGDGPQSSAIAEVGNLISSLGSLSAQAQSLPLSPPTLPGISQGQSYRPQATDYTQFNGDSN